MCVLCILPQTNTAMGASAAPDAADAFLGQLLASLPGAPSGATRPAQHGAAPPRAVGAQTDATRPVAETTRPAAGSAPRHGSFRGFRLSDASAEVRTRRD